MRTAVLFAVLGCALNASAATMTFEQILARAHERRGLDDPACHPERSRRTSSAAGDPSASLRMTCLQDALRILESPAAFDWPVVRAEGAVSNARNVDIFNENVIHNQVFSAIVSVDYPLLDGGAGRIRRRAAMLDAAAFRQRTSELEEELFTETVDAVARLYAAQERRKILQRGLERAAAVRKRADELLQVREISNLTAAQWQDEAIAAEGELIDLELLRLDAEARVKMLIGDGTSDPIEIELQLDVPPGETPSGGGRDARPTILAQQRQLFFDEARAARRPQVMLSAFGGVANADDRYALYGLRVSVALPMFDAAARRREAQARIQAAEAELERAAALDRRQQQASLLAVNAAGLRNRIQLLSRAVDVAKQRAESVTRLTSAGLRSESALAGTLVDVGRRESQLLAARVELWRYAQLMRGPLR